MLNYTGELYARMGRKHCPTGKTGADWDALEAENERLKKAVSLAKQHIAADYGFEDWRITQVNDALANDQGQTRSSHENKSL